MSTSPTKFSWFVPGLLCVTMGVVVPTSVWVDVLRPGLVDEALRATLLDGALVFKIALALLGALMLVIGRATSTAPTPVANPVADRLSRRSTYALWALLGVALVLRVVQLNAGLWHDEIATLVNYGQLSPGEILTTYDSQNQHFLYSLLARPALAVFGSEAFALRLPAVLFGVAGVAALFFFAREVGRPVEAWLAAALMTLSYHHVWFSQNARGYTALLFWTLFSSWFFVRGIDRGRDADWVAYALSAALGVFTHLTMAFVIAGQLLIYAFVRATGRGTRGRPVWLEFLMGFGLGGLLVLVLYAFVMPQIVAEFTADTTGVEFETWQNPL
ncbi:MAG TPA: glycosyltransferase family 39 protein, partial [Rhodothermales bacterium]